MKYKQSLFFYLAALLLVTQSATGLPKVENNLGGEFDYTKNELQLILKELGGDETVIGKITKDGLIHFDFPEMDIKAIYKKNNFASASLQSLLGMTGCKDEDPFAKRDHDNVIAHKYTEISINKYGVAIAQLSPVSSKGVLDNNQYSNKVLKKGSQYSFYAIDSDVQFKEECMKTSFNGTYDIELLLAGNIKFNKGINLIEETLVEIQDYKKGDYHAQIPKKITYSNANHEDTAIKWHIKRSEGLTNEKIQLAKNLYNLTPLTKKEFMKWVPKKLGDLSITSSEYGATLPRSKNKNNVHLVFSNEAKKRKIEVYIVDSAKNIEDLGMAIMIYEMDAQHGDSKQQKLYVSQYKKDKNTTKLIYKVADRIVIDAVGLNMKPDELWGYIKKLNIEKLISQP